MIMRYQLKQSILKRGPNFRPECSLLVSESIIKSEQINKSEERWRKRDTYKLYFRKLLRVILKQTTVVYDI